MNVIVNAAERQVAEDATVRSLLAAMNLRPEKVAIELNRKLLRSGQYDQPLKEGDRLEIVTFVGGG
jgi:thiamine biosynthesis protein ThiS